MSEFKQAINEYIEYYNYVKIVNKLGMSPIEYRIIKFYLLWLNTGVGLQPLGKINGGSVMNRNPPFIGGFIV